MNRLTSVVLDVSLNPDPSQLPFTGTLADLTNGLAAVALILALAGAVLSAGRWGIGVATSNLSWAEQQGKVGVIVSAGAALLIGGAAILINFFFHLGGRLH